MFRFRVSVHIIHVCNLGLGSHLVNCPYSCQNDILGVPCCGCTGLTCTIQASDNAFF